MSNFGKVLFAFLAIFSAIVFAGDVNDPNVSVEVAQVGDPNMSFAKTVVDLGEVGPGTSHNFAFEFTNKGDAELKITKTHAPCGCTVPNLKKKKYAPGESGKIDVKFKASKGPGKVTKSLFVYSNDKESSKIELLIKCNVVLKVKASPESLELKLDEPNAGGRAITLTSLNDKEFSIKSVKTASKVAVFDFDKTKKAKVVSFKPIFNIDKLRNKLNGAIIVELDHPDCSSIIVRYEAKPEFVISPRAIIETNAQIGKKVKRTLWITSNYNDSIKIESVKSKKGTVKVLNKKTHGNRFELEVELDSGKGDTKKRYHSDQLEIKVKGGPKLSVRCQLWFAREKK